MHVPYGMYICTVYGVHGGGKLIWWFGNFRVNRQILCCTPTLIITCITNVIQASACSNALFAKLNVRQFAIPSNSPNLMIAKCTIYMLYVQLYECMYIQYVCTYNQLCIMDALGPIIITKVFRSIMYGESTISDQNQVYIMEVS